MKKIVCSLLVIACVAIAVPANAAGRSAAPVRASRWVAGEVVVRYRADVAAGRRASIADQMGSEARTLPVRGAELLKLEDGQSVSSAIDELEARPEVLYAEPNYVVTAARVPNDPGFARTWGLHSSNDVDIDAPEAWAVTTGSSDVTVAIVDTGVDYNHPDLAPNVWRNPGESGSGKETNGIDDDRNGLVDDHRGWDFADGDRDPIDVHGHGTHVAGTVGARGNDGIGVSGVNWDVQLMPLRVLGANGSGSTADVASAIRYAAANGASVVNASLGGPDYSRMVADAIAASPGVLVVAAAGNDGTNNDTTASYPCNLSSANVVCVAAHTSGDALADFSNYGATSVDLGAPGSMIYSTVLNGAYGWYSGTSMATPHVAGAAALLWSAMPAASVGSVRSALLQGVDGSSAMTGRVATGGRLNVHTALRLLQGDPTTAEPAPEPDPIAEAPALIESPAPVLESPPPVMESPNQPPPVDSPAPPPTDAPEAPTSTSTHDRSVSLRIGERFVATGRVSVEGGLAACFSGVSVKVKRNGVTVARGTTRADGRYEIRLARRASAYKAVAPRSSVDGSICAAASSSLRYPRV